MRINQIGVVTVYLGKKVFPAFDEPNKCNKLVTLRNLQGNAFSTRRKAATDLKDLKDLEDLAKI